MFLKHHTEPPAFRRQLIAGAGHFLAAYLLGVPAASLQLSPFAVGRGKGYLARVVWHSAEWDLAASAADARCARALLTAGAEPDMPAEDGSTALESARLAGSLTIEKLLHEPQQLLE